MDRPQWDGRQACAGVGAHVFFPEDWEEAATTHPLMRATCAGCVFLEECREWAILHEEYGWWGGLSRMQRKRIRKQRGVMLVAPSLKDFLPDEAKGA